MTSALDSSQHGMESLFEGFLVLRRGRPLFANRQFCALVGRGQREILAMDSSAFRANFRDFSKNAREFASGAAENKTLKSFVCGIENAKGKTLRLESRYRQIVWEGRPAIQISAIGVSEPRPAGKTEKADAKRFRDFAEVSSDWFWEMNPNGSYGFVSKRFFTQTGILPRDFYGKIWWKKEFLAIDPVIWERHQEDLSHQRPFRNLTFRIVNPKGKRLTFVVNGKPNFDNEGKFRGYRGTGTDITKLKAVEEDLEKNRTLLRTVLDSVPSPIFAKDADGKYIFCNKVLAASYRTTPEKMVGKKMERLPGGNESQLQEIEKADNLVLATGKPLVLRDFKFTAWDGQETVRNVYRVPLRAENGEIVGFVGTSEDITQQVRANETLRQSEEKYRSLAEGSLQGILVDRDFKPLYANSAMAQVFGYSGAEEIMALRNTLALVEPALRKRMRDYKNLQLQGAKPPSRSELRGVKKDGSPIWLEVLSSEVQWEGKPAIQAVLVDVTERKKAQQALQAAEEYMRSILAHAPINLFRLDLKGKILFTEGLGVRAQGLDPKAVIGKSIFDLYKDYPDFLANIRRALKGETFRATNKTFGRVLDRWLAPTRDDAGKIVGMMGVGTDVTDRSRKEQEIRESEARFRNLVEGSLQGICVHRNFKVLLANQAMAEIFGYESVEELTRIGSLLELMAPRERSLVKHHYTTKIAGERSANRAEYQGVRKDGSPIRFVTYSQRIDWQGEPAVQVTLMDVTQRRRAEESLVESRQLLQTVFDTIPHSIYVRDTKSRYVMANTVLAERYGKKPKEIVGRHVMEVGVGDKRVRKEFLKIDRRVFRQGRRVSTRFEVPQTSGESLIFQNLSLPLRDAKGRITGLVGVSQDITAQVRSEEEIRNQRNLLQSVFEALPLMVWVKDRSRRVVMANSEFQAFHEFPNFGNEVYMDSNLVNLSDNNLREIRKQDREILKTGVKIDRPDEMIAYRDGTVRWRHLIKNPIRDQTGSITGIVGVWLDVTERKVAQTQIEESEKRYRDLVEGSQLGTIVVGAGYRLLFANRELVKLFGYRDEEEILAIKDASLLLAPHERGRAEQFHLPSQRKKTALQRYEAQALKKNGEVFWVEIAARRIDWMGEPASMGIFIDITARKNAELGLRENQRLLKTILETLPFAVWAKGSKGKYTMVNRVMADRLGRAPNKIVGQTFHELRFRPPKIADQYQEGDRRVMKSGNLDAVEEQITNPYSGQVVWRRVIKAPILDDEKKAVGIVGVIEDITERKLVEEELRSSEERHRNLIEGSIEGIVIHSNYKPLFVNDAYAKIFGYKTAEEVSKLKTLRVLYPREDLLRVKGARLKARQRGRQFPQQVTLRGIRKDGRKIFIESFTREVMWKGKTAIQATLMDITERTRAEERLRENQRLLNTVFQSIPLPLNVRDKQGKILMVNPAMARRLRRRPEELIGTNIYDAPLGTAAQKKLIRAKDLRVFRTRARVEIPEMRIDVSGGGTRWFRSISTPLLDNQGEVLGLVGVNEDITERKIAAEKLLRYQNHLEEIVEERTREVAALQKDLVVREKFSVLGQVTATVSHELRNPLGTIRSSVHMVEHLARKKGLDIERHVDRINRSINRCNGIIEELLDYTRSTGLELEPVAIDELAAEELREVFSGNAIKVLQKFGIARTVVVDKERFRRALINVLQNARQAIEGSETKAKKGRVRLETGIRGARIFVRVSDNGPGIPTELQQKVFEPLYSTKGFGVGLGLSVVKQVMEAHGGSVKMESTGKKGTSVTLWLPSKGGGGEK